jgi:hypothetical protein
LASCVKKSGYWVLKEVSVAVLTSRLVVSASPNLSSKLKLARVAHPDAIKNVITQALKKKEGVELINTPRKGTAVVYFRSVILLIGNSFGKYRIQRYVIRLA